MLVWEPEMKDHDKVHGTEVKQEALKAMTKACQDVEACPACAATAALYLASAAASQQMQLSWEEYLEVVTDVWKDVTQQNARRKDGRN